MQKCGNPNKSSEDSEHMTPSAFMQQMSLTTHDRLALLTQSRTQSQRFIIQTGDASGRNDNIGFEPIPSEIVFQNFQPCEMYEIPFMLRNRDKVGRSVHVTLADSPYFKIICHGGSGQKVAPGMTVSVSVRFTAQENKDYSHELVCRTDRETFTIPIRAIGPRAVLDFPDVVQFPSVPVKHPASKTFLLRNIGRCEAKFSAHADRPFSVEPSTGLLAEGDSLQVTIQFTPSFAGDHSSWMDVSYDTGERVRVMLHGSAADANVRLDRSSVRMESTSVSRSSERTVTIHNRSGFIARYQWKPHATPQEEELQKNRFYAELENSETSELSQFMQECQVDPTMISQLPVLSRTYQHRKRIVEGDSMLFTHSAFTVSPQQGEIWPNSSADVTVTFTPRAARLCTTIAYCEVTGRESRLPLRMTGEGVGPKVQLSYDVVDVGKVFIGSRHSYEVVLANKGDIDATCSWLPSTSTFGKHFSFVPAEAVIQPKNYQSVLVVFTCSTLGEFAEEFLLAVNNCEEPLRISFKGTVIGPSFHFDKSVLDFGKVSYGFENTAIVKLFNTSLVAMKFNLRISQDEDAEFTVAPSTGSVAAQSSENIKVSLIVKNIRKYETSLVVDVDEIGSDMLALPISARSVVPVIEVVDSRVQCGRCFIGCPYRCAIQLRNCSNLPGRYSVRAQNQHLDEITYTCAEPEGEIPPLSLKAVPIVFEMKSLDSVSAIVSVQVDGVEAAPLQAKLCCIGEGPVVHCSVLSLDWGVTPVLTHIKKTVTLSNESLIPAEFVAYMLRPGSVWKINPDGAVVNPRESLELTITAYLDDSVRFQDRVQIDIENGQSITIPTSAIGQGTTIVSEPPLGPVADLGYHFSNFPLSRKYRLTNRGRRHHQITWSTAGHLPPGESADVELVALSRRPLAAAERLLCHAIIGRCSGKERVMAVDVRAEFVSPLVAFSTKQLLFSVRLPAGGALCVQTRELVLENVSSLLLSPRLRADHPFGLVAADDETTHEMTLALEPGASRAVAVRFDPSYRDDRHSRVAESSLTVTYAQHPHVDSVALRGEVGFPNLRFERRAVDFGCVLNGTETTRRVTVTNTSPVPVSYAWSFHVDPHDPGITRARAGTPPVTRCSSPPQIKRARVAFDDVPERIPSTRMSSVCRWGGSMGASPTMQLWENVVCDNSALTIPEVFDILPLRGSLQPGESDVVTLSFFGHEDVVATALAACEVDGGPTYELQLSGAASDMCYELTGQDIDFGKQMFDQWSSAEVTLRNIGQVGFNFSVQDPENEERRDDVRSKMGISVIVPNSGFLAADDSCVFTVNFLPGVPDSFCKSVKIQVGHFEPEIVTIRCEGVFQRLTLDLPRQKTEPYQMVAEKVNHPLNTPPSELEAVEQSEVEHLLVREHALMQALQTKPKPEDVLHTNNQQCQSSVLKVKLPGYNMDLGYIVKGRVHTGGIRATNTGSFPVSFHAGRMERGRQELRVNPRRVKALPVGETVDLEITLDTSVDSVELGQYTADIPIQIPGGASLQVHLSAVVTEPRLLVSATNVRFDSVKVGERRVVTLQLHNDNMVACSWSAVLGGSSRRSSAILRDFPIEFYCLEMDRQYLEDEQMLRMMPEYSESPHLLLPPWEPGGKFPPEIVEYCAAKRHCLAADDPDDPDAIPCEPTPAGALSPAELAVARHVGVDASAEAQASARRRGVAVIVHGAPTSGKTACAAALAARYSAAVVSVDVTVMEAVAARATAAGRAAWEACAAASHVKKEHERELEKMVIEGFGGKVVPGSGVSTPSSRKASNLSASQVQKKVYKDSKEAAGGGKNQSAIDENAIAIDNMVAPSSQPLPILDEFGNALYSCALPESVLADILADRLQQPDCYRGVVFDSLQTLFSSHPSSTVTAVLKAINNRKHIHFLTLHFDENKLKQKQQLEWEQKVSRSNPQDEENSDNMACFNIVNNSMTKTEVNICFQKDVTGKTFLLEQSTPLLQPGENHITLEPGESKPVRLWAYPKSVDMEEEVLLCCVKDNPEVVRFPICCRGLRPELTIIKKMLSFDRVLLHRKETKTLYLKNQTQLPFRWKLSGQETLGEDFTFPVDSGVVEPLSEFALHVNFRAVKPSIVKKAIRIEVFDMDQILGLVQTENIQIQAEGYDVALDMTFPKGTDGGLDFSTTRVFDDSKQSCSLKNKGKYEIGFSFQWQTTDLLIDNLEEMFSVVPARGSLGPNDRPLQVSFVFRPTHVVIIKEEPILKCFIIETNLGQDGQTVACIPIKISAKSTFSRYGIVPTNDTHFGALAVGARKVKTFSIENTGEFDFKYTISKLVRIDTPIRQRALPEEARPPRSREGVGSGKRVARRDSLSSTAGTQQLGTPKPAVNKQLRPAQDLITTQSRLILGMFTIQSAFGTVYPGQQQVVNVECAPEAVGYSEEELAVNITDRNPDDYPYGIPYKLIADACVASINTTDVGDIFEEHMVCKSLAVFERFSQGRDSSGGVYCEEEGRFVFRGVTVGKKQMARFKITNISKIACDVIFSLKSTGPKQTARGQDIFEVDASRQLVAACSATYATVSFTPTSIQPYSATFEAHVEGGGKDADRVLAFEVYGDGSLPQVTVVQPSLCNKEGQPMLHFPRTLLGRSRTLTVVLKNEGTLSSKVSLDLEPDGEPFTVVPQSPPGGAARELAVGETATYNVNFAPTTAACFQTNLAVCVEDNDYENAAIVVAGDGFADDVTVELAGVVAATADARAAADAVVVDFGDCAVGAARSLAVVIANHAAAADAAVRFQWPDHALLRFSPQVGHLHAGCSKEVTLTLTCAEPRTLADERLVCRLTRLAFAAPVETVPDWDDRRRAVRWDDEQVTLVLDESSASEYPRLRLSGQGLEPQLEFSPSVLEFAPILPNAAGIETEVKVSNPCDFPIEFYCLEMDRQYLEDEQTRELRVNRGTLAAYGARSRDRVGVVGGRRRRRQWRLAGCRLAISGGNLPPGSQRGSEECGDSELSGIDAPALTRPDDDCGYAVQNARARRCRKNPTQSGALRIYPKVVEVEPEPACTARDAAGTLDLLVSATADYARFACAAADDDDDDVDAVSFRDTYVFRTRRREFSLENTGAVRLAYSWSIAPAAPPGDAIGRTSADSPLPGSATGRASTGRASVVRTPVGDMTGRTAVRTPLGGMSGRTSAEAPAPGSSVTGRAEPGSPGVGADDAAAAGVGCRVPFAVEPQDGVVSPGETVTFTASFSPLHVDFFTATAQCSIPNLADGETGPCITLRGRSLLPYCHFELDDEDATAGEADERTESAGVEPAARVVRLAAVGTNSTVCRTFATINPTNTPLRYAWESQELDSQALAQPFKCLTPKGEIDPGMTCQMKFEFTATELGQLQSRWQFVLPERDITVPFLLIGSTREPIVMFDKSHVNFKSLLVGHSATDVVQLLNEEDTPMLFSFVDASRYTPGFESHVDLAPMIGTIPPKEKLAVRLTFTPSVEGEVNFNLVCNVRMKMAPLTVNAKARGYALTAEVRCEDSSHKKVLLTDAGLNTINFGELDVKEAAVRAVYISNTGKLPLDYEFLQPTPHPSLAVDAPMGSVAPLETAACTLCFCPQGRDTLRDHRLDLKFHNGPTVRMVINGCGAVPKLEKSFTKHDFGPCFLYKLGMPAKTAVLKLTNQDTRDIGLDCLHVSNGWLEMDFQAQVLPPGGSCEATFTFCPRQTCNYQSAVQFEINGLSKFTVHIKGQGVVLKVEVVDARHKTVRLGSLKIGHVVKKEVSIVNRSVAATTFHLALQPSQAALEDPQTLALSPLAEVTLKPRATCDVEVIFSPKTRIVPFSEEVALESEGVYLPLFMLMGSCQGLEVGLDTASVPFGAVVLNSQSVRTVVMHNTGDIGTKFRWDTAGFGADFSIVPLTGYVSPGMDVTFTITFHPKAVSQDIRREGLKCRIEGGRPLLLTLTGVCVSVCPWREVLSFNAHVRQKDTKSINIPNKSSTSWTLKPVIDGEQWSGAETVFVEAGHTCAYELTYLPLTMTTIDKKHAGSIFFPLPDGNGLLYNVSGLADQPRCSGKIQREVPCKTSYTELLRVHNWLSRAQRFKVTIESQKLERLESTTIKGLDYIDVPGNSKDYKLNFYAYKEGTATVKVMFRNEKTGEYQWYEVSFRATRPGYIGTVQLSTAARRGLAHALTLENPLPGTSTFTASCALPEVLMPAQLSVPPLSEGHFRFEYLPIKQGEVTGKLELTSADLGQYLYELKLTCTAPLPERPVHFSTCLGSHQVLPIRFLNFARQKSDYQCKVNNGDFSVDKSVMAAPGSAVGTEVTLDALYEPSQIGETHALLTISSPVGGEYTFPLVGTCLPPRPQGPITVKAGPSSSIVFRNVLPAATTFAFVVDKPCFSVGRTSDTIRPRRDHKIMLSFDASQAKAPVTGKLTVMTVQSAGSGGGSSNISWVYYLRGVPV
ncbi:PREDICTED: LOW QUALITY PROTEIN: hydrocephalus-inducing protein homolog [Priapulus caudatus]|uniref:LOW QUALITY PROTEIN: hydrocephalus-inducing protein homolog n=1 Tax=Priapulus caudatus TaxID=37621 RepID=A0ABM1E8I1_PRICU|nr:PREDICTED: LOW QUALITY PROTEIN: hydrocephalus-inducing protein homolog [Priapulus caudatus]